MKRLFLIFICGFFLIDSYCQTSFGIKAGVNIAHEKETNPIYTTKSHAFFCGGVYGNFNLLKKFYLDASLLYSGEGYHESYQSNGANVTGVVTENRLEIPLLIQYHIVDGLFVETGPQAGFLLSAKGKYSNDANTLNFASNSNSFLFSWCIGGGYKLKTLVPGLGLEIVYAPGLSQVNKGAVSGGKITASNISIRLFYGFDMKHKNSSK